MKTFSGLARFAGRQSTRGQVLYFVLVLAATTLAVGCGKAKSSATESPASSAQNIKQAETDHMPVYTPTAASVVAAAPNVASNAAPDLAELNRDLLRWILRNRRKPASFEDFSATAGVVIPPPPAGKRYVIAKDMHIQLVER
jgi:hypothetical protein